MLKLWVAVLSRVGRIARFFRVSSPDQLFAYLLGKPYPVLYTDRLYECLPGRADRCTCPSNRLSCRVWPSPCGHQLFGLHLLVGCQNRTRQGQVILNTRRESQPNQNTHAPVSRVLAAEFTGGSSRSKSSLSLSLLQSTTDFSKQCKAVYSSLLLPRSNV